MLTKYYGKQLPDDVDVITQVLIQVQGRQFVSEADACKEICRLMELQTSSDHCVSDKPVVVTVHSCCTPSLTIVDTPGVVKVICLHLTVLKSQLVV